MEDIFPTLKDYFINIIMLILSIILTPIIQKVKYINVSKFPHWLIRILLVFSGLSVLYFSWQLTYTYWPSKIHKNEIFQNETVILDNNKFYNCQFIDCKLVIKGRKGFTLYHNNLLRSHLYFQKRGALTLNILLNLKIQDPSFAPMVDKLFEQLKKTNKLPENTPYGDLFD